MPDIQTENGWNTLPLETIENTTYDAIIVGAGAAGGMAARQLTLQGMHVLCLDAGYTPPLFKAPWRRTSSNLAKWAANPALMNYLPLKAVNLGRRGLKLTGRIRQPVQTRCFAWERAPESFVDDRDNPYSTPQDAPFDWFRARQPGGRMIIPGHGRQYFRLGERDFLPQDGFSPAWPFPANELSSWYSLVEETLGMTGMQDGCSWTPDSDISHPTTLNPSESDLVALITDKWSDTHPILGRSAPPPDGLRVAMETDRLDCRSGAVVREVLIDANGRAAGIRWHDQLSRREASAKAPIVFLCASSLESTRILMMSTSGKTGQAPGASSGALGAYLMDHIILSAQGEGPALPDEPVENIDGRCIYVPRFDLRNGVQEKNDRGFGTQIYRFSMGKGRSYFNAVTFAEMTPRSENRITLNPDRRDKWGLPTLHITCRHDAGDLDRAKSQANGLRELGDLCNVRLDRVMDTPAPPGTAIHECGTARMGLSPDMSVVDANNECWDAKGLYVTDGASFPSQGAQNPTLTILALTARACAHATQAHTPSS